MASRLLARARGPPREVFTAGYWADLVAEAERGLLDLVTIEDGLGPQSSHVLEPDERTDRLRGRLDAVLVAARIAPLSRHIGIVPTVVATHTEPFHISKAIATLDYVSSGRAGLRVQITARPDEAAHFGRRTIPRIEAHDSPDAQELVAELFDEAADHVEVVRRLWDSWEDDAEIRDVATGRFIDRGKLHYIDFEGRHFSVKGPSITPAPTGPAPRHRPRPRHRPVPAGGPPGRRRIRHAARHRPGTSDRRRGPRGAASRRTRRRAPARLR
ncbi:LLM class flavin-dependent oxidoreductase [Streptomyces scabiei]|uniref:LLM class flavin-dependent oxidoreductase n=1 Tax=Streptomyces scabiei TaxID=1930 RepID=UPI001FF0DCC2|nr:LLM class flavin-dependent oxidoreductase [Streptomyces sp. LBUM 1475]